MLTDLVVGTIGSIIGLKLGFGWNSIIIFLATIAIDGDIVINELYRIFIKKEKKFGIKNFLDENSYTHKFILHLPLLTTPIVFIVGLLYSGSSLFALLVSFVPFYTRYFG